jgi:hypothetical protein
VIGHYFEYDEIQFRFVGSPLFLPQSRLEGESDFAATDGITGVVVPASLERRTQISL